MCFSTQSKYKIQANISNYNRANDVAVRVCVCVWQSTPRTADVTVTKIASYVRVRILVNRSFFSRIFGIHSFYSTATLLNSAASGVSRMLHAVAPSRGFPACYI